MMTNPSSTSLIVSLYSISLPKTVKDILTHYGWCDAIKALDNHHNWEPVYLPQDKKVVVQ